jgi:hypothetical protein
MNSSYLYAYEDGTVCSETSEYKIKTPGNYPGESIQHSEQGESLKLTSSGGGPLMMAQWLRYCATNRKVAGSIPDGVI